jgi:hypothetical protein
VSINGILQTPTSHYYIDSSSYYDSVVLDELPKAGSLIEIRKIQYASPYSTLTSSFSTTAKLCIKCRCESYSEQFSPKHNIKF